METSAFSQLLTLYTWFLLAAFITFLMLIARFYSRFAKERTYYLAYLVPIVLFGGEAVRQTRLQLVEDGVTALLAALAGLILMVLAGLLFYRMTHGRRRRGEAGEQQP